jgi:hypothetical protein
MVERVDVREKLPDTLLLTLTEECATCRANVPIIVFKFPTAMYLPAGQLEHRLHRSRFLKQMAELYDQYAEAGRQECLRIDPQTVRPPLEKIGLAIIDASTFESLADMESLPAGEGGEE